MGQSSEDVCPDDVVCAAHNFQAMPSTVCEMNFNHT